MAGAFTALDWSVVLLLLCCTTWFGHIRRGSPRTMREFFLGGQRLPWYAVSASIVATEISAVTYISLPSVVWRPGGDLTYLQLALLGSFLARIFIAWKLVPAYYEREILSPYDYMGARRGEGMRRTATILFTVGGVLGQSARVYQTGLVLEILLHEELAALAAHTGLAPLSLAILAMGVFAVLWTWMGGMATVIWTDALLFGSFFLGSAVMLASVAAQLDGGLAEVFYSAAQAGKLRLFDFDTDPTRAYTFWAAAIGSSWSGVGQYGTDQLMAQRLLCCPNVRQARKAVVASIVVVVVIFVVQCVGLALWRYTEVYPLQGAALELTRAKADRIVPVFVLEVLRPGLRGLVVAGALAAAISSLDSILAALAQTTQSLFRPLRDATLAGSTRRELLYSRALVLFWGVVLCAAAIAVEPLHARYGSVLDLALSMATYTVGALLAGFALAYLPLRSDGSGFFWSGPLSVLAVFGLAWHGPWAEALAASLSLGVGAAWLFLRFKPDRLRDARAAYSQLLWLALALGLPWAMAHWAVFPEERVLAFPWYIPCGSLYAFIFALVLARPSTSAQQSA